MMCLIMLLLVNKASMLFEITHLSDVMLAQLGSQYKYEGGVEASLFCYTIMESVSKKD